MLKVSFRFYEELNDYLPRTIRKKEWSHPLAASQSVKEAIEQIGIPPDEVDLILANGISVDFSYEVKDGDRISVYPIFETFDISGLTRVREQPLKEKKKEELPYARQTE